MLDSGVSLNQDDVVHAVSGMCIWDDAATPGFTLILENKHKIPQNSAFFYFKYSQVNSA